MKKNTLVLSVLSLLFVPAGAAEIPDMPAAYRADPAAVIAAASVATPAHFPDEFARWLELRIELYESFYCVWSHNRLFGVGHFEPQLAQGGLQLEVGPVNCDRVMFRNVLVVDAKHARQVRRW